MEINRKCMLMAACLGSAIVSSCASFAKFEEQRNQRLATISEFVKTEKLAPSQRVVFGLRPQWSAVGHDEHLVLWKHNRIPVLVSLDGPCRDLNWAQGIQLGRFGGLNSVRAGFDSIYPVRDLNSEYGNGQAHKRPSGDWPVSPCRILTLHEMTKSQLEALRAALNADFV